MYIFLKGKERQQRLGKNLPILKDVIWIHAASMGEVNAVKSFILKLKEQLPKEKIVISTMTKTGQQAAEKISTEIQTFFFPIDVAFVIRRVFRKIKPKIIIIAETELWPNLLDIARKKGIPVEIINGRISDNSLNIYSKTDWFWKNLISDITVNAKSEIDAERFRKIGFNNVINAHNLKFCLDLPKYDKQATKEKFGFDQEDFILVFGSSRPGEEQLICDISDNLIKHIPKLKMVIVPRHLNRIEEVKKIFPGYTISSQKEIPKHFHIVDEMGVLTKYYSISDLVIIGGSFYDFGGHNPLESAYYSIPTIIGNFHHSCQDSVKILTKYDGIVVSDYQKLSDDILGIYKKDFGKQLGKNGRIAIEQNLNSLQINLERTTELLDKNV